MGLYNNLFRVSLSICVLTGCASTLPLSTPTTKTEAKQVLKNQIKSLTKATSLTLSKKNTASANTFVAPLAKDQKANSGLAKESQNKKKTTELSLQPEIKITTQALSNRTVLIKASLLHAEEKGELAIEINGEIVRTLTSPPYVFSWDDQSSDS